MTEVGFSRSSEIAEIATAIAKAQGRMTAVQKNKTARVPLKNGGEYTYSYADVADVIEMMRAPLSENGLAVVQFPVTVVHQLEGKAEETVGLTTLLTHTSGQWFEATLDTGRWAGEPQQVGVAITYYKRYTLQCLGLIAAESDTDGVRPRADGARNLGRAPGMGPPPQAVKPSVVPAAPRKSPEPPPPAGDEPIPGGPGADNQTKGQKLAAWAERQNLGGQVFSLAQSNYGCTPAKLSDEQADALFKIVKAAKLVEPNKLGRPAQGAKNANGNPVAFGWPKTGSQLYAWSKSLEEHFKVSVVKDLDSHFGPESGFGFPRQFKEWTDDQVECAALHVARKLKPLPGYDGQFDAKVPDLAELKLKLAERIRELLTHQGHRDPSFAAINQVCQNHSATLPHAGGELLDDLDQCENTMLLSGVLRSVELDLAEIGRVTS